MSNKSLFRGTSISVFSKIINALFNFLALVLLARILTVEDFGYFNYILTSLPFLTLISMLGIDYLGLSDYPLKRKLNTQTYHNAIMTSLIMIFTSTILLMICTFFVSKIINDHKAKIIIDFLSLIIPIYTVIIFSRIINQSKLFFMKSNFPEFVLRPALFFVFLLCFFFIDDGENQLKITIFSFTIINFIAAIIAFRWVKNDIFHKEFSWSSFRFDKTYASIGPQYALVQLLNQGTLFLFPIYIGYLLTVSEVGYFRAAQQTASLVSFILVAVNNSFAPMISTLYISGNLRELSEIYSRITKYSLLFSTLVSLVFIWFSGEIMNTFGQNYRSYSYVLIIMTISQIFASLSGASGMILLMLKKQKYVTYATIIQILVVYTFSYVLYLKYDFLGVIIGLAIGMIFFNLMLIYYVKKVINIGLFDKCIGLILFCFASLLGCYIIFKNYISGDYYFIELLSSFILLIILYLVIIWFKILKNDEKEFICRLTKNIIKSIKLVRY